MAFISNVHLEAVGSVANPVRLCWGGWSRSQAKLKSAVGFEAVFLPNENFSLEFTLTECRFAKNLSQKVVGLRN